MDNKKFQENIATALTNPDADMQYQAAQDLATDLEIYYQKYPQQNDDENTQNIIKEVYRAFFIQLKSQYRDVQGNAIKQFQKLAPLMKSVEAKYISLELLKSSIQSQNEVRENYHICLQEIVDKIPITVTCLIDVYEEIIIILKDLKQKIKLLQQSNQIVHQEIQENIEIQAELLKMLSSITSRWPQLCKKDISDLLLDNIIYQNELSIRKNSCVCLGYLGICLSKAQLNELIQTKILPHIEQQQYDNQNFMKSLYINQSLNYLAKSAGKNFDQQIVKKIYERFFQTKHESDSIDFDLINQYAEILEIQLLTINYLISNPYTRDYDFKLMDEITPLIEYDPFGVAAIEEENQYDDEQYYVDETTDSTWRARRCAIYTFQELLKNQPKLFKFILSLLFGQNQLIMKRINEKNAEIRSSIIQFLITLVSASSITLDEDNIPMELEEITIVRQRSIPSSISIIELIEQLLQKIEDIYIDQTEQQSLKSESTKLLLAVAQYFHKQIQSSNGCFNQVIEIIHQSIKSQNTNYSNEQRITSLLALKIMLKIDDPVQFQVNIVLKIIDVLLEAVNQKYIRIAVEAYLCIDVLLQTIKKHFHFEDFKIGLIQIKNDIISKIKIDNLDQDMKISLFSVSSTFLKYFQQLVTQDDVEDLASVSLVRLQIEALITSVFQLVSNLKNLKDPFIIINAVSGQIQRYNKPIIYQTLIQLLKNNSQKINQNLAQEILYKIKLISTDNYDQQIQTIQELIKLTGIKISDQFIIDAVKIGLYQSKIKPEIEDFFHIVNSPQLIEQQLINKQLTKEELYPAGQIYCQIMKHIQGSLQNIYKTIDQNRQLKLSSLRFLHKYQQYQDSIKILCQLINENKDADLAALVIGQALTSFDDIKLLIEQNKHHYYYYLALKEYIEKNLIANPQQIAIFVIKSVSGKDKTVATICGDILGQFLKNNYDQVEKLIFDGLNQEQQAIKFACVQSLKYSSFWNNKSNIVIELLQKEKDLNILTGIVKAITQNVNSLSLINILQYLPFCLRRFEEKELNFGNFTEKRDDAKDLRSLSFDLLEIIVDKLDQKIVVQEIFEKFAEDKYDETRIPRIRIMLKILSKTPQLIYPYAPILIKVFTPILTTIQTNLTKQDQNLDKDIEKIRLIIKLLDRLRSEVKDIDEFYKKAVTQKILQFIQQ